MENYKSVKKNGSAKVINSIGFKVGIIISILLFLILGLKATSEIIYNYTTVTAKDEKNKLEETRGLAKELELRFATAYQTGNDLRAMVQSAVETDTMMERNRDEIVSNMTHMFRNNNNLFGMGVYFEPNAFDGSDAFNIRDVAKSGRFTAYVYGDRENATVDFSDDTDREWYRQPMSTGKTVILEPYLDHDNHQLATTYAYPILKENKVIGVVIVDVALYDIKSYLEGLEGTNEDYKILVTDKGTYVADSSDKDRTLKNISENLPEVTEAVKLAQDYKETVMTTKLDSTGKDTKIVLIPVDSVGTSVKWAFASVTSVSYANRDANKNMIINIIVSILTTLIIGAIIFVLLIKKVMSPLSLVEKMIVKMSEYDLDLTSEKKEAEKYISDKSEIGNIIKAVEKMVDNLVSIMQNINANAQNTAATAEELTATAQSTADAAGEVGNAVTNIAEGATVQAQESQSAVVSAEESGRLLGEMLVTLDDLSSSMDFIMDKKNEGDESLKHLAEANALNNKAAGEVHEIIIKTNESAERISAAREMIQSISDQTNLLALNAAIEAARAGEQGKGFAVVAEEIRKLAEQSAGFTEDIRKDIDLLKSDVEKAVNTMNGVAGLMEGQNEKMAETGDKFKQISEAIEKSQSIVETLDKSSKEIEEKNAVIMKAIENLSAVAEDNAATTEEAAAAVSTQVQSLEEISGASENLANVAVELQEEVAKFRL
ncbi:MAG: methyl-accepting chemotaxis protein [Catonella sp.]|uniref:methyl-accepting chemotaxis protein n=1 Tax=Catonella sp. TaxID=2382125 RepID=UPI003FA0AAB2